MNREPRRTSSPGDARPGSKPGALSLDEALRCDTCGVFGAFDLGDQRRCEDCYRQCGSCCPEFGGHDLWSTEEED